MAVPTKDLQNMRDIYYGILKEEQDSSAYPYVLADAFFNNMQNDICAGVVTNLTTQRLEQIERTSLPFLYKDQFYTSVQDIYISDTDLTIGGTTITATDTSGFGDTGFLWINENIIEYTGNTGTSFTGCTGIAFAHKAGARISQLFVLPTDWATSVRVVFNNQIPLDNKDYRNIYLDQNNSKGTYRFDNSLDLPQGTRPFYTIIHGSYLLPFQLDQGDLMIHMIYEKTPTAMTDEDDLCTIPDAYSEVTIPILAAADTLYNRGEEDRGLKLHKFGLGKIMSMYSFYANQNNEDLNNQRIETGKDMGLNL